MQCAVGGIILSDGPYMVGAGVCKNPNATKEWLKVAPVVSGSYTPPAREGNAGNVVYPDTLEEFKRLRFGLNAYGMPNMGFGQAAVAFTGHKSPQPLIVSIAGFSVEDYLNGVAMFESLENVAAIELNFGCPNTQHGQIMSFMRADVRAILSSIRPSKKPIWVKFSPYSNPHELRRMADLVSDYYRIVRAVVTCNTFPNAYDGKGKIDHNQGRAGLSGPVMKQIALGQVHQFKEHLDPGIDVIGVGGIANSNDIMDFLDAGAKAVQMTSWPFWVGDPRRFMDELSNSDSAAGLIEYLTDK